MIYKYLKFTYCTIFHKRFHLVEKSMGKVIVGQIRISETWLCSKCKTYWIESKIK